MTLERSERFEIPVLPLRDVVVFPHMVVPLFVGREKSVRALEEVMADDKQILLSSQIDPAEDDPDASDWEHWLRTANLGDRYEPS